MRLHEQGARHLWTDGGCAPHGRRGRAGPSGMEFSGQYGISHADATVTKNSIFDWATFSDSSRPYSGRRRYLRTAGAASPGRTGLCDYRQGLATHPGGTAARAAEYLSAAGSAEHRSIPRALPGHSALRRDRPRRGGPRDRRRGRNCRGRAVRWRGTPPLVRLSSARRAAAVVQTRLGRSPRVPLRDGPLRHMPRLLKYNTRTSRAGCAEQGHVLLTKPRACANF